MVVVYLRFALNATDTPPHDEECIHIQSPAVLLMIARDIRSTSWIGVTV
jgi:hypothetical protein